MNNILELKEILETLDLGDELKSKAEKALDNLEMEMEELKFIAERYKRDQRVNENFVKKTVELLEASNERLSQSNDELLKANFELTKSNEELERFAYIASHDLKTPLYNIIRFSGLLNSKLQTTDSPEIRDYLSFIISGGKRMQQLIEDVLEYSKHTRKTINNDRRLLKLDKLITEILSTISERIEERNAVVEISPNLPELYWEYSKIFLLFKNLIENGIKYNVREVPTLKIYSKKEQDQHALYVEDNGIGIEEQYFDKVFQMFTRLHNQAEYEGSGLGLATCKKIVNEFGGEISLESQLSQKTIFKIYLPSELIQV